MDLSVALVDAAFTQASFDPQSISGNSLSTSCIAFTASATITPASDFGASFNGMGAAVTLPASTTALSLAVAATSGPTVTYSMAVSAETPLLTNLVASPGGPLMFAPATTTYNIFTAWDYIVLATATSANARTEIGGTVTSKANITLPAATLEAVTVALQSAQFGCTYQNYTVNVSQVALTIASVDVLGSTIHPAFSTAAFDYVVTGADDVLSLTLTVSANAQCQVSYQSQLYSTCDLSTIAFPVTQLPSPLTVALFVPTDNPVKTVTYTFGLRKVGCVLGELAVSSVGGLSNCTQADTYPATAACVASQSSEVVLSFAPYMGCAVQLVYNDNGNWLNCGGSAAGAHVTTNCSLATGLNAFAVIAQDPYVTSFFSNVANISVANGTAMYSFAHVTCNLRQWTGRSSLRMR